MSKTPQQQRDHFYEWFTREFEGINGRLDAEGQVELDGKLWALSAKFVEFGFWKAFLMALAEEGKQPNDSSIASSGTGGASGTPTVP